MSIFLSLISLILAQATTSFDREAVTITDTGYLAFKVTTYNAGPAVGDVLNSHFFPGINFYIAGRYTGVANEMTYIIDRPGSLDGNPRKSEFLSTTYFLRGMVYSYHASGVGRYSLARIDFENAVKWNSSNHPAHLELARVYVSLGIYDQAVTTIQRLLELKPEAGLAEEARAELVKIKEKATGSTK